MGIAAPGARAAAVNQAAPVARPRRPHQGRRHRRQEGAAQAVVEADQVQAWASGEGRWWVKWGGAPGGSTHLQAQLDQLPGQGRFGGGHQRAIGVAAGAAPGRTDFGAGRLAGGWTHGGQGPFAPLQAGFQPLARDRPGVDGGHEGVDGGVGIGGHQDQVGAGAEGEQGRFAGAVVGGDRLHHQGIGDDQPLEAQVPAQQAIEHGRRQGGGPCAVEGFQQQVGRHHAGHPGGDRGAEGGQLHRLQPLAAVAQQRQLQVGVAGGVAMAGEVLGAAEHPLGLGAAQEGRGQAGGRGRVLAPGAHVDHRVGRVVIDIANGPQHPVQAQQPGLAARAAAVALGQGLGVRGGGCGCRGSLLGLRVQALGSRCCWGARDGVPRSFGCSPRTG